MSPNREIADLAAAYIALFQRFEAAKKSNKAIGTDLIAEAAELMGLTDRKDAASEFDDRAKKLTVLLPDHEKMTVDEIRRALLEKFEGDTGAESAKEAADAMAFTPTLIAAVLDEIADRLTDVSWPRRMWRRIHTATWTSEKRDVQKLVEELRRHPKTVQPEEAK